ncbi:hypothetical protein DPMN_098663 [Dreissena polymorpha]|uniref:Uncharacterized protein n=1 Tax=Dreissena polymorpha TaxID=45954 RepID=A0A9D4LE53_DREPO|nr:hypothetical protein DPMN_098663 [Dreissena polymorpha]
MMRNSADEPKDSKGNDEDCVEIKTDGFNNAQCERIANRHICQTYPQGKRQNTLLGSKSAREC